MGRILAATVSRHIAVLRDLAPVVTSLDVMVPALEAMVRCLEAKVPCHALVVPFLVPAVRYQELSAP